MGRRLRAPSSCANEPDAGWPQPGVGSAPGVTRTPGQRFRKPLLYPSELQGRGNRSLTPSTLLLNELAPAVTSPRQHLIRDQSLHMAPGKRLKAR
jgi:hypothetical protein